MNQQINLGCQIEGNPRPVVFWKLRKSSGQVVDAICPQGFDGQYQEVPPEHRSQALITNIIASYLNSNYQISKKGFLILYFLNVDIILYLRLINVYFFFLEIS